MKIEVKDFHEGPLEVAVDHEPEEFDLQDEHYEFPENVRGTVTFQLLDPERVFARGRLETLARTHCVRCLKKVDVHIKSDVHALFEHKEELLKPEQDFLGSEDEFISYFDGEVVDPREQFREALVLELPHLPVCEEACRGLCPKCGANLNETQCTCEPETQEDQKWKSQLRNIKLD